MNLMEIGESKDVLSRVADLSRSRGPKGLAERLLDLQQLVKGDLELIDIELSGLKVESRPDHDERVARSGLHLLDTKGKRLRPTCVALAARLGSPSAAVPLLGSAVELVHSATLLHDDVVDLGEVRRGVPAARMLFGNAASIFAGDWLLVEALRRVSAADGIVASDEPLLIKLLSTIEEMIFAESLQLESRGDFSQLKNPVAATQRYLAIVEGKTASLFRWAMYAGASAGGLSEERSEQIGRFGLELGIAFQVIDDLLDYRPVGTTGKNPLIDLKEGKLTYPLLLACERDASLQSDLLAQPVLDEAFSKRVCSVIASTGALADTRAFAKARTSAAIDALSSFPESDAKQALLTVAASAAARMK